MEAFDLALGLGMIPGAVELADVKVGQGAFEGVQRLQDRVPRANLVVKTMPLSDSIAGGGP